MSFITNPDPFDVLLGRGLIVNNFSGNIFFRDLVNQYTEEYSTTRHRTRKNEIASRILSIICNERGGRFLRELKTKSERAKVGFIESSSFVRTTRTTGVWIRVDDITSLAKIKHALRDAYISAQPTVSSTTDNEVAAFGLNHDIPSESNTASTLHQACSLVLTTASSPSSVPLSHVPRYDQDRNSTNVLVSELPNRPPVEQDVATRVVPNDNYEQTNRLRQRLSAVNYMTAVSQVLEAYRISSLLLQTDRVHYNARDTPIGSYRQGQVLDLLRQSYQLQQPIIDQNNFSHPAIGIFSTQLFPSESSTTRQRSRFISSHDIHQTLQQIHQLLAMTRLPSSLNPNASSLQEMFPRTHNSNSVATPQSFGAKGYNENGQINSSVASTGNASLDFPRMLSLITYLASIHHLNATSPTTQIRVLDGVENQNSSTTSNVPNVSEAPPITFSGNYVEQRLEIGTLNGVENHRSSTAGSNQSFHEVPTVYSGTFTAQRLCEHSTSHIREEEPLTMMMPATSSTTNEPIVSCESESSFRTAAAAATTTTTTTTAAAAAATTTTTAATTLATERNHKQRPQPLEQLCKRSQKRHKVDK